MTRRGQPSRTVLDREYPHQVLVRAENLGGKTLDKVADFHVKLGISTKSRSIRKNDAWYTLRWHRSGFKAFWHWKSRHRAGRPKIDRGLRDLIRRMSKENPLWGASRIHGELLMLGFAVAQSTVSKYLVRPPKPPSQTWKTFLRNHAEAIAAIDLCVVPTLTFDVLFAFLVLGHGRRQLLWFEVTLHPTAEWLARQVTEAFPWASAPAYLVRKSTINR